MARKPNRVISEKQKEQDMAAQNLKRKKNNNLKDQKRTRTSKVAAINTPLSDKQTSNRAEEALQEIEERFRLAFENANIGMCLVDLQGRLTKVNHQMCEIFGYSQEELERMTVNDIAHPEDLNISPTFIKRATSGEIEHTNFEKRYFHKDGHIVWGAVSSSLVRDPQGAPQYFISHVQDITQRKKAEEALKEGERFLTNIFSSIQDGISILDTELNILRVNPAMEQWYSHAMPLIGKKCYEAYHGRTERCEVCPTYKTINTGKGAYEVVPKTGKGGKIVGWLDLFSFPLVDTSTGKMKGVIEYVRDITERKRAEEVLRRSEGMAKRMALENAMMAEIGRIISSTLNIEEVYERFAEEVHELIPFEGIAINIINHKEGTVTVPYVSGIAVPGCQPGDVFPLEGSVTGEVARTRSGLIIQAKNIDELKNRFPTLLKAVETGLRSVVAVPLLSKDQVIGAIHFRSTKPNAYSDQNLKLAEDIASQIAGAIANGQLFMEQKHTEEALRSEHDKFRGMLSALGDGVDIVNKNYIIEFQNELLRERYGDKIGEKCFSAYMGLERPCDFCSIQEAIRTGHPTRIELVAPDGRNYELNSSPFRDVDGEVKVIELVRDITERKQAEEVLREESLFRTSIIEHATEGLCVCHETVEFPHVAFTVWNDRMTEITGYSMDEINRLGWYQTMYPNPEVQARAMERMARMRQGDDIVGEEWEITRADGEKRLLSISTSVLKTSDGIAHVLALMQDITERKRAEGVLQQSEEKYRTILENIEDAYYEVDLPGNLTFFNDSLCRLVGYSEEELMGMNNRQLTDPENAKKLYQEFNKVYRTGGSSKVFNWEIIKKDGTKRNVEASVSLIKDSRGHSIGFRGIVRDITEHKGAEDALRESEERYRNILSNIEDGYYEVDISGNFSFFNNSLCKILGYPKEEMIGMNNRAYMDKETARRVYQAYNQVYTTGEPLKAFGYKIIRKDGIERFVESHVSLLTNAKGERIGFRGIARDMTERKQAEEALRQSEERYRTILENIEDGYYEVDLPGNFTFFNDSLCRMLGYSRDEMIGMGNQQYTDQENRKKLFQAFNEIYRTREPTKGFDWKVFRKDGTKLFGEVSVSLIKDSKGQPIGFRGIARDITKRKQAEEALHNEKQRFQTLSDQAPFGMVMIDQDGTFKYMNPKFRELFGYDLTDIPDGKTWFRKAYPNPTYRHDVIEVWINDLKSSKPGEKRSRIFTVTCKDGTEKAINFIPVQLETDENLMACEDITERKRAEEENTVLQEQLRQSQKMEAIGRLGGGIAHDFNNLLTIIKGYSQLSLLDLKESDPLWGNIQEIQKATQRATDLTRQLLAFSRRQILDLKVLDLNILLRELDKMLRRIIGEDIELVTLLAEDLGRVKIDPGQIEQVILNLAVNARDAMPSGGKLTIETANVVLDEEYAHAHVAVVPGHYVRLSISDTGVGMPRELMGKVFEPFFTTKEKGKGTGLGLSMVYGIVKQIGGNIWVYSEPGHGTTFKIYLPRVEEQLDTFHALDEIDSSPRGGETVLLVEDDPSVRDLALRLLRQQGYTVLEAANGVEALHVAQEHGGEKIHLLLTDVVMPQMGGKELADQLKIFRPDVKVLYTSGYTDDAIVHHGVLEPGTHFLQKPFSLKTLSHKVREVLDR